MNPRPLNMIRITARGVYCVRPDLVYGIVELPTSGWMVPDPFTVVNSNVLPVDADRIAAHAHRTNPNTPVAMGLYSLDTGEWATAQGWWFSRYQQAALKAQSLGSEVYLS